MPTSRRRHAITESDDVAAALREAAAHWPEDADRPQRLLLHLLAEGRRSVRQDRAGARRRREQAIADTSGALTGAYGAGYLETLREDWPG